MHRGLASFAFARRYLRNRCFFLFLRLLRCFSSPGSLPYVMDWRMDDWSFSSRVSPFRYLRINGYLLLPVAFRSLSRLSSALSAKASTLRSFLLDLCRCIALHLSFVSTSFEIVCFLELIKTFVSTFGLLFSDVLIFFKEYLTIELLMFNCINQLSLCMKFSRYMFDCLSVIRNLNSLKPLITGNPVIFNSTSLLV